MLQIFILLFCALSYGKAKSIVNATLKDISAHQNGIETKEFKTTENDPKIKSYLHKTLKNEQNITVRNDSQQIAKTLNDTLTTKHIAAATERAHILYKIHATLTRSKDAIWATITLTFMCVLLVLAVAQSKMWKDYNGSESQGVPLPNFNERVLFKDVMERRMTSLKEMFKKKKKPVTELEMLLPTADWE